MKSFITGNDLTPESINEARNVEKSVIQEGRELFEKYYQAKKYQKLGEMFNNPAKQRVAAQTVILMENQQRYLSKLEETTVVAKFGEIAPKILDILRLSYPNQVAHELVDVQTMKSTHDIVYFIRPVYSTTKSGKVPITQGTEAFDGGSAMYASEEVLDNSFTTSNADLSYGPIATSYAPIRPSTVYMSNNGETVGQDDGNGNLSGSIIVGVNTIAFTGLVDYTLGRVSITFASNPGAGYVMDVLYAFDSEQNPDTGLGIDIVFGTYPVTARAHKMNLQWSVDAALTAASNIGIDVEDQLSVFAASELKAQQDLSLADTLIRAAGGIDSKLVFSATNPSTYYPDYMYAQGLRLTLAKSSNEILTSAHRGETTWYIVATDTEAYLTYLDGYVTEPNPIPIGIYRVGTYKGKPVYKHTYMSSGQFLAGYKGSIFGDAGCILAKYIELYATPTLEFSDFLGKKGIASFYDKRLVTTNYYKLGQVSNL